VFYKVGKRIIFTRLQDGQPRRHDLILGGVM